ncbi:hypothetical protein [Bacillus mycoides]|uniref:hypothetical protein n=1 Tax=Bacillus mycoides TaxID=1405 RepID=UPI0013F17216|nr:hypothetical protein [Bacillus mycoides]MBJ7995621.1 hypothetical protein [Bacillus cereus]QWI96482.1 hypothetical protein J5V73_05715 [Bacillus mycoides]UNJ91886.1 hypothetical protein MN093_15300 [Bacillus mycoides]
MLLIGILRGIGNEGKRFYGFNFLYFDYLFIVNKIDSTPCLMVIRVWEYFNSFALTF